ncbi:shikimate dehydrogenase family protein [Brevundimonas lutea]|uniref:shikimate dehydrogenase family protein n=1 Tax=Brevundimonas lutea TaxID=2293980 RepID=UPI000F0127E2|nr:shikimate dehydrogenase [Brevundimonas lutea]
MRIAAATRVGGVVGRPIGHSLSPVIHNAWIEALNLDAVYLAFPAEDEAGLAGLAQAVRSNAIAGLNVTAPYKAAAFAAADHHDPAALSSGSVNLLTRDDGGLAGGSTDGAGVLAALAQQGPAFELAGARVLILGAGGAAAAAIPALVQADVRSLRVLNRTASRAVDLAGRFGDRVSAAAEDDDLSDVDLVLNAMSGDGAPFDFGRTPGLQAALDMTYRPVRTEFLIAAESAGAAPVDGLAMLIGQARPSFEAIFGTSAPDVSDVDVRALCLAALEATP